MRECGVSEKLSFDARELLSLPSNWCWATLDELMKKIVDGTHHTPTYVEDGVPFLSVKDVRDGKIYFDNCKYISQEEHQELCKRCYPEPGDLLITKSGTIGRCAVVNTKREFSLFVSVALLKPAIDDVNTSFISLAFQAWFQTINVQNDITGSAIKNFHLVDFRKLALPLPSLNEQHRIVAKIEALKARSQRVKEELEAIAPLLDQFRQSVLAAAFRGDLTADWREKNPDITPVKQLLSKGDKNETSNLPSTWCLVLIEDVIHSLKYGTSKKCDYEVEGTPVLRIPNIGNGIIDQSDLKYADLCEKELEGLRLAPGDILVVRSNGSVSLVGKSALIGKSEKDFAYAGYLIRLRPNKFLIDSKYLNLCLASHDLRLQIEVPARSTSGVHNINSQEVKQLQIALPPIEEQQEIVRRIETFFKTADQVKQQYQEAQAYLDKLNQSILAKAFRGELVPQDPNDEPASVLLERIRAEREKLDTKKKAKGKTEKKSRKAKPEAAEPEQLTLPGFE